MKRTIAFFMTCIFLIVFSTSAFANESVEDITENTIENITENTAEDITENSVVMAINEEIVIVNGVETKKTPPIMVLDKTYVDLYAIAPVLGFEVKWVEAYIGYFTVTAEGNSVDFTLISKWNDLNNSKYKFFVKDSVIYVSLRELAELKGYNITYDDGIITLGNQYSFDREIFGNVCTDDFNDYIYIKYPAYAQYVVNPYLEYSYETMMNDVEKLKNMYPELIKTSSIGKSVEGRDLLMVEFGRGSEKIFVCGTHHAREYIATTYLIYAIDRYAYAYRNSGMWNKYNVKEILDNITFCIVPMVNPDGVNLVLNGINAAKSPEKIASMGIYEGKKYGYKAWKANVNGVDLNWNYNKDWSVKKNKNPRGSTGFNGDQPYTEPETIAVSDFVDNNSFCAYLSFHTQGEIFYWADNPEKPTHINKAIKRETGFKEYLEKGTGVGGSFFDYVYRKFKKPTITVELCPYIGNYPYPVSDFDRVWKPSKNILLIVGNEILYNKNH